QQDAAERIAERLAEAALERFGHQRRITGGVGTRSYLQLVRPDQFLPIFLDRHCLTSGQLNRHLALGAADQSAACKLFKNASRAARPPAKKASDAPPLARTATIVRDR